MRRAAGDVPGAVKALEKASARAPHDGAIAFQLASHDERTGDLPAAARGYEQVIALGDPQGAALSQLLFLRKRMADWHDLDTLRARFVAGIAAG